MKKFATLTLALCGFIFMNSCTDNDDTINTEPDANVAGTYRIISYSAPTEQDLDEDGDSSVNLTEESACYSDWTIVLNADNTFARTEKIVSVSEGAITCQNLTDGGTWSLDGQTITLLDIEGAELNSEYTYLSANSSITQTRQGQFPTIFENFFIMENGTINLIYVRE